MLLVASLFHRKEALRRNLTSRATTRRADARPCTILPFGDFDRGLTFSYVASSSAVQGPFASAQTMKLSRAHRTSAYNDTDLATLLDLDNSELSNPEHSTFVCSTLQCSKYSPFVLADTCVIAVSFRQYTDSTRCVRP